MLNEKISETINQLIARKTLKMLRFIIAIGLFATWGGLRLEAVAPETNNVVRICFVDSKGQAIPYYASHRVYLAGDQDRAEFRNYIQNAWDELLPHEEIGGGIGPSKNDTTPYFIKELDLNWWDSFTESALKRFRSAGYSGPVEEYFYHVFPNGYVHVLARTEVEKMKRDQISVLVIYGDLGSGQWKDLGNFLFKAAYYWRVNKGSQKDLLKQCDSLIETNLKAGNLAWAGNLSFVREMWFGGASRAGLFGHKEQGLIPNEDRELPWRNSARSFLPGRFFCSGKAPTALQSIEKRT
jgi:hypothetical protein